MLSSYSLSRNFSPVAFFTAAIGAMSQRFLGLVDLHDRCIIRYDSYHLQLILLCVNYLNLSGAQHATIHV
jgi:hypothetical protein